MRSFIVIIFGLFVSSNIHVIRADSILRPKPAEEGYFIHIISHRGKFIEK